MRRKRKTTVLAATMLAGLLFWPQVSGASLITIEIEAVVDLVNDQGPGTGYLEGRVNAGDILTGSYTYDSSVTRVPGERYQFDSPPNGVFLSVGGFDFQTDPTSVHCEMGIGNDLLWGDTYFFLSFSNLRLSNDTLVDGISWSLEDPSGTALSTDALPMTAPILDHWAGNRLRLYGDRMWGIDAVVTSAELIPEPATLLLLSFGAIVFVRTNPRNK